MTEKAMFWSEKKVHIVAVVVSVIGLLAALGVIVISLNNTTTILAAAVLNTRSDWAVTHTFSFSATGLTNGEKTIDVSGGGKFVMMTDRFWNVWLKGRGSLVHVNDGTRTHWKAPETGLYNQLEGKLWFTATTGGNVDWITPQVDIEITQSNDINDPSTGNVRVTIGTQVFEGLGMVSIS